MSEAAVTGRLIRGLVSSGSKSEREGLLLESDDGTTYLVRRRGAPAWGDDDPDLAALVGRRVALTATNVAGTLLVDGCDPLD